MRVICSPDGIVDPIRPGQGVGDLARAGFSALSLDLNIVCSEYELEQLGKPPRGGKKSPRTPVSEKLSLLGEYIQAMVSECRGKLELPLARAPFLSRDTKRTDLNELMERLAAESIKVCGEAGCKAIVIRPLFAGIDPAEEWEVNRAYYLRLAEIARVHDVTILLENQCRDCHGHLVRGICAEPRDAAQWVDKLNAEAGGERFGFCMDVGVCSLCGQDMQEFATALGGRLKAVVLRDCDGYHEASLLPFTAAEKHAPQTDWLRLIRGLREIAFDGQLVLSMGDTAAAFSPLLRPQLLSLAVSVAHYFKWQIEIESTLKQYSSFVLFGAGNMCRNYMKCYGEKYPPLFVTCNSQRQWGTSFCGLEVKPPQALLELPEDCAVVICNVYYREIEQQLHEMGIQNIGYFNDEYMPSFYTDRLERGGDK